MAPLPEPHTMGIKRCERCLLPTTHRVFMSFIHHDGWHCRFFEWDMMTSLPRQLTYREAGKICETARRGHGLADESSRGALDKAIKSGRGGIWLHLTDPQFPCSPCRSRSDKNEGQSSADVILECSQAPLLRLCARGPWSLRASGKSASARNLGQHPARASPG
jgi:hypothetical protein